MTIDFKDLIIFENENYIIVNKPPGMSSLDDRATGGKQNILRLAKNYHEDAQLCHRLDRETSGALAIAKNPDAYRHLSIKFEDREVKKVYHAVVNGVHDFQDTVVNLPIHPLKDGVVRIDKEEGKPALTVFATVKAYYSATLVKCLPVTGRMHQIRIHLSCLKAPIVSDSLYGGKNLYLSQLKKNFNLKKDTDEQPIIKRFALHARELVFEDLDGKELNITAEYPKDFAVLLKLLEKYS
ncbi:MAG: RluA family pseudouridine synthase [Cytophagales bacterium]